MKKWIHVHGKYEDTKEIGENFDLRYTENGVYYRYNEHEKDFTLEKIRSDWIIIEDFKPEYVTPVHRLVYFELIKQDFYKEVLDETIW